MIILNCCAELMVKLFKLDLRDLHMKWTKNKLGK